MISLNNVPVEIAVKYGADTAIVYAILYNNASDGICKISWKEITNISGISASSIARAIKNLESLKIVKRYQNKGKKNEYHIKNVFDDAASEQPPAKSSRQEPEPESVPEPVKKVKKSHGYQVPYFVMLDNIGSDLASEQPKSEEDIKGYERNTEECTIPEEWAFSNYHAMVEDALKYLAYYSDIEKREYKKFVSEVCTCLAEAICNGMKGNTHSVDPVLIIRRINEIIHDDNYSFGQWLHDYGVKYDDYIRGHAETIYNKHSFLKTCAVNFLTEHRAGIMPEFTEFDNRKDWL